MKEGRKLAPPRDLIGMELNTSRARFTGVPRGPGRLKPPLTRASEPGPLGGWRTKGKYTDKLSIRLLSGVYIHTLTAV